MCLLICNATLARHVFHFPLLNTVTSDLLPLIMVKVNFLFDLALLLYVLYKCRLLPLYFPRDKKEEKIAVMKLPADVGDENGETIIDERKIRIKPLPNLKKTVLKPTQVSLDVPVSDRGLTRRLVIWKTHYV